MALVKKVGTGFEGGHTYKNNWSTEGNTLLHAELLQSWGLKSRGEANSRNRLILDGSRSYTTNQNGAGVIFESNDADGNPTQTLSYEVSANNFEVVCATRRDDITSYDETQNGHIRIETNIGQIIGMYGDDGIKWSDTVSSPIDLSSLESWEDQKYNIWHIKCAIALSSGGSGNSIYILSTGRSQSVSQIIEYTGVSQITEIGFGYTNRDNILIDDLTIWEDSVEANAKSDIDSKTLQRHIRYFTPTASVTDFTTNNTSDNWTANTSGNDKKLALTDGDNTTFCTMTDKEGGLKLNSSLDAAVSVAGYPLDNVKSIAAVGSRVEDNASNDITATLNEGTTLGGGETKTKTILLGGARQAYYRFDGTELSNQSITKNSLPLATIKLNP